MVSGSRRTPRLPASTVPSGEIAIWDMLASDPTRVVGSPVSESISTRTQLLQP